jgi:hypothetical protein
MTVARIKKQGWNKNRSMQSQITSENGSLQRVGIVGIIGIVGAGVLYCARPAWL